tara:strand:- start:1703 stop:3013 length:1311 start_codon:yes stop_codon:yes gene_type:complete
MYQANGSVIINNDLGTKADLFPEAQILMFVVLDDQSICSLDRDSGDLKTLHQGLSKETPVIICSAFKGYNLMDHQAQQTRDYLLLAENYDYLRVNKILADYYDLKPNQLPALIMVDAKSNQSNKYILFDGLKNLGGLYKIINAIHSMSCEYAHPCFKEIASLFNKEERHTKNNKDEKTIFRYALDCCLDPNRTKVVARLVRNKYLSQIKSRPRSFHSKMLGVILDLINPCPRADNSYFDIGIDKDKHLNIFSKHQLNEVLRSFEISQSNTQDSDELKRIGGAFYWSIRCFLEAEIYQTHFAHLRRLNNVDIKKNYITYDEELGDVKHFNIKERGGRLFFPSNNLIITKFGAKTAYDIKFLDEINRICNQGSHFQFSNFTNDNDLFTNKDATRKLVEEGKKLKNLIEHCSDVREKFNISELYFNCELKDCEDSFRLS